jgi:hypothetical protein
VNITGPTVDVLFRDHIEAAARECFCRLIAVEGAMRTLGYLSSLEAGWHQMPDEFKDKISRLDFIRIGREEVVAFRKRKK